MNAEAMELEFKKVNIPYEKEKKLPLFYDGQPLKKFFKADVVTKYHQWLILRRAAMKK